MRRALAALACLLLTAASASAQGFGFGVQAPPVVMRGATCPPVSAPATGAGTVYVCTGTGAVYVYAASAWSAVGGGGGGTPANPTTSVQFNNAGSFGGSANAILDATFAAGGFVVLGPPQSTLVAALQNLVTTNTLLVTASDPTINAGLGVQAQDSALAGIYSVHYQSTNSLSEAFFGEGHIAFAGQDAYGIGLSMVSEGVAAGIAYGVKVYTPVLNAGGTFTTAQAFYTQSVGGTATNAYAFWADERGVYRIKADNTHEATYQAVPALYNYNFTKYTAGAANFERGTEYWDTNVYNIGAEKGGTGTLRNLKLIGGGLVFDSNLVAPASSGTRYLCISTAGVVTSSAVACTGT